MPVVVVGLSHKTSPVELRERLAFSQDEIPSALEGLRSRGVAREAVIVSTCNRVEVYAFDNRDAAALLGDVRQFLIEIRPCDKPLTTELYALREPESIEHLFRVVCGLDSMVLGETEVLGQVKESYRLAMEHGHTGPRLNKTFQRAFQMAKQVRTHTNIQRGNTSVGSVAVELAEKIFSSLDRRKVLVVGAGDTGEKTARALLSRGAREILVTNRSFDRAEALAMALGGQAVPFDQWQALLATVDIVVSSTSAPGYVLYRASLDRVLKLRKDSPLLLIDIAVPRDIEPEVNQLEDVYLYDIDDLQTIADHARRQREEEVARCEGIIRHVVRQRIWGLLSDPVQPSQNDPATPSERGDSASG